MTPPYSLRQSVLQLLLLLPFSAVGFRLLRHHWPTWDLLACLVALWFLKDFIGWCRQRQRQPAP